MDGQTRRRLEDLFRSANFNELTTDDMVAAGVPEASRAEFVRRAAEIHNAFGKGDHGYAQDLRETAVQELGEVVLEDASTEGSNDPRALAANVLDGAPDPAAADDEDPRKLSEGLSIY
jgi:hypothetical protein